MWAFLGFGTILGLSAGISPGPLLTVVITQTLHYNAREGIKVATAPLLTDLPIICVALLLFRNLPEPTFLLGLISFVGAAFLAVLGIHSLRRTSVTLDLPKQTPQSYLKGAMVNALNPHPYVFWFAVGVPTIIKAAQHSPAASIGFVLCFFISIVGSKVTIALLVGRWRDFLAGRAYLWTMRILGLCLIGFALLLLKDGFTLTGLYP